MADESKRPEGAAGSLGDMPVESFRRHAHDAVDRIADYLERLEQYPVLPGMEPGTIRRALGDGPPEDGEPMERIFRDYSRWIEPNITHWQHPHFMAYFSSIASGPGILGEMLAAGLNSNVMLWRNAPASTELEQVVVGWLRQLLGLPQRYFGMFTDTASVSSLLSLVAARQALPDWDSRKQGIAGPDAPRLRMYQSTEAHSSIDKAAITIGIGTDGICKIPADDELRMCPNRLRSAIAEDRAAGWTPFCVVATLGTTSSTSADPCADLAAVCQEEGVWLHVDAAYAGAAAVLPEMREHFAGWERADSIVFNLHKWFFTPFDASLLLFNDPDAFREAFSLVPEYLKTQVQGDVVNFNEYGIQLGRRFRALKVWMQLRYFGAEGIRARLREHCRWARQFRGWVEAEPDWEMLAPTPFSTLCFRYRPEGVADGEACDRLNAAILDHVNEHGGYFLSHTKLGGRYTIRVALGNLRQTEAHVRGCWEALRSAAQAVPSSVR